MNIVAIDGPAGAGKSTIAKKLAERLDYLYIDSGALYRALTWFALKQGVDFSKEELVEKAGLECDLSLELGKAMALEIYVNQKEVSNYIRTHEVNCNVSITAKISSLRRKVNSLLRDFRHPKGIVMDGRDIGTVVFPDATFKFFVTASAEERARRRYLEHIGKGEEADHNEVLRTIIKRDRIDSGRQDSPLKPADDARTVDTTSMSIDQVLDSIREIMGV